MKRSYFLPMLITVLFMLPMILVCQTSDIKVSVNPVEQSVYVPLFQNNMLNGQCYNPSFNPMENVPWWKALIGLVCTTGAVVIVATTPVTNLAGVAVAGTLATAQVGVLSSSIICAGREGGGGGDFPPSYCEGLAPSINLGSETYSAFNAIIPYHVASSGIESLIPLEQATNSFMDAVDTLKLYRAAPEETFFYHLNNVASALMNYASVLNTLTEVYYIDQSDIDYFKDSCSTGYLPTIEDQAFIMAGLSASQRNVIANYFAGIPFTLNVDSVSIFQALSEGAQTTLYTSPPLILTIDLAQNVTCSGGSDGKIHASVTGGSSPYFFQFITDIFCWGMICEWPSECIGGHCVYTNTSGDLLNVQAGTYTVKVYDANGHSVSTIVNIFEPPAPAVTAGTDITICEDCLYTISGATATNYSAVLWTSTGDGVYNDETLLNPTYTPGPADIASATVELCITAYPDSPCTITVTDCMVLSIQQASPFIQDINLQQGWLGISSYIVPDDSDIENVLYGIEDEMKIILRQSPAGIYWPGENLNTIGNWDSYKGYKIKMNQAALLSINGVQVNPPIVTLPAGSSFLPVLSPEGAGIEMLSDLGNDLMFALNLQEQLVYWPAGGLFTLQNLEPGIAYLIRLNNEATFDFSLKSAPVTTKVAAFVNNTPWNDVTKTGDAHIISVSKQAMTDLAEGDVIGVFNHLGLCVGMNGIETRSENTALIAYGDDFTTSSTDGLATGENMTFRLYRPSTGQSADLEVTFDTKLNTGTFEPEAVSMITGLKVGSLGINDVSKTVFDIYPNPSNGVFNVVTNSKITIQVMNVQGQTVNTSQIERNTTLDLSSQPKGIYFIKVEIDNSTFFKKLVIN